MQNISLFDFEPAKITSRAKFFAEIEPHLPIKEWIKIISPIYHAETKHGGRPPKLLEIVLRTYLIQNFFSLSDEATEDAVCDILSVRKFVGISVNDKDIPDKSTICRFRNLLIEHNIQQKLFEQVVSSLSVKGLIMKKGTIVDSTIIESSTSKRNIQKACDPESAWTKKAGNFKHGYKAHIGVDANSGLITSNKTTPANVHDATVANDLLHGDESKVYGDSGYLGVENRKNALSANKYHIMKRRTSVKKLDNKQQESIRKLEHTKASKRAKVEHCFATIKRLFGWKKTMYRSLKKNSAKLNILFALANIWKVSRIDTKLKLV